MAWSVNERTMTFIALYILLFIGLLNRPVVTAQESTEVSIGNGSNVADVIPVANNTVPAETTTSSLENSPTTTTIATTAITMTTTTTTTTTTTAASRVPLLQLPEARGLLQSVLRILSDELSRVTIDGAATDRPQVIREVMQNLNLMRTIKRIVSQDDIRNTFPKPEAVRQRCYDDVIDFVDGLIGQRPEADSNDYYSTAWALKMMDSFGKPPAGITRGTMQWVGNYDQCLDVHATIQAGTFLGSRPTAREESSEFYPRYCRVQTLLPGPPRGPNATRVHGYWEYSASLPSLVHWGMCLPESCGEHEVVALVAQGLQMTASPMSVANAICFDRHKDLGSDAGAVVAVCLLSTLGAVVVFCTVLESLIFYGYFPWYSNGYGSDTDQLSTSNGESSTPPSHKGDGGKAYHHLEGKAGLRNDITKPPSSANQRTPLSRDGRPKDVLGGRPEFDNKRRKSNVGFKLLQGFSIRYNGGKLWATATESNPGVLSSIQGIRVISICWIILGHTYTIGAVMDVRNIMIYDLRRLRETAGRLTFTFVAAADLGVDTFFLIGGVLVMMMTLKELRTGKGQGIKFWIVLTLHRLWRLTPVYMMVLMTGTTLYDYIVDGPLMSRPYMMFEHCKSHWWTNLLYINNIIHPNEMCMIWSWYLAIDVQLFLLAPPFIILVHKKHRIGIVAMVVMVFIGVVATFVAVMENPGQMLTMFTDQRDFFKNVYVKSYTRMAAFFIGMLTAVAMEDYGDKFRLSKIKHVLVWISLSGISLFIIMMPNDQWKDEGDLWPKGTLATFESLKRPLWSLFVGWVIFTCETGHAGKIGDLLMWKGYQPLARLTYAGYLLHPMIITFFLYERNLPLELEDGVMIYQYFGNVIMTFLFAAVFALLFESPLLAVEKVVLHKKGDVK